MKTMRIKCNINKLCDKIIDALNSSKSKFIRENGFGIEVGLNIVLGALKEISERAIETEDIVILSNLLLIGAISCDEQQDKEIEEKRTEIINKRKANLEVEE